MCLMDCMFSETQIALLDSPDWIGGRNSLGRALSSHISGEIRLACRIDPPRRLKPTLLGSTYSPGQYKCAWASIARPVLSKT